MPEEPRGQKRPTDVLGDAIAAGRIEGAPKPADAGKDPAATAMGKKGGAARARRLTPEQRAEIARKAAAKRWSVRDT